MGSVNAWDQIKAHLGLKLSAEGFQNWLANTSFGRLEGSVLYVAVPNEATRAWMREEYADLVSSAIRSLSLPVESTIYELGAADSGSVPEKSNGGMFMQFPQAALNPRLTFENFVVGSCNQFAHAAAKAVAGSPSKSYNPLFIYGGVGMGKTHLMHAIGSALMDNFAGMRIVYTSSERFMNELIQCISLQRMPQFHEHYRRADILLVDDIQTIGGKERTQEEFFHTFNELYDHQKQIVISSDSSPKHIPGLVERLRSRFESPGRSQTSPKSTSSVSSTSFGAKSPINFWATEGSLLTGWLLAESRDAYFASSSAPDDVCPMTRPVLLASTGREPLQLLLAARVAEDHLVSSTREDRPELAAHQP